MTYVLMMGADRLRTRVDVVEWAKQTAHAPLGQKMSMLSLSVPGPAAAFEEGGPEEHGAAWEAQNGTTGRRS
ncbi:MAG: hypothetical protein M1832_005874 [Thelocarpon impressellum]|nr:MAG: hypothetical protein M1832_005874 [Thelocarpon impressellum]